MPRLSRHETHPVRLTLNGRAVEGTATPRMLLTDFLRHGLAAFGTHVGCEHGVCGACTVRIDGRLARACLAFAVQVDGAEVETVEGLAPGPGRLSVLQEAFQHNFAVQCGFCTPGILMSLDTLFRDEAHADEARIREVLSGHLCRCTGYAQIIAAALDARDRLRETADA